MLEKVLVIRNYMQKYLEIKGLISITNQHGSDKFYHVLIIV